MQRTVRTIFTWFKSCSNLHNFDYCVQRHCWNIIVSSWSTVNHPFIRTIWQITFFSRFQGVESKWMLVVHMNNVVSSDMFSCSAYTCTLYTTTHVIVNLEVNWKNSSFGVKMTFSRIWRMWVFADLSSMYTMSINSLRVFKDCKW